MSTYRNECSRCGGLRGGCRCPAEPDGINFISGETDARKVNRARRDFTRRVEEALESGDQTALDRRIARHVREA